MFEVPQRARAIDDRLGVKVVCVWRGSGHPLEGPGIPRVGAGNFSFEQGDDEVHHENNDSDRLNKCADRHDQIQGSPATIDFVRINLARHAENSRDVHRVESYVETDYEEPEM